MSRLLRSLNGCLGGVLLWLTGCASSPVNHGDGHGVSVPERYGTGMVTAGEPSGWLADFADETLGALVREGLANNRDLQASAARLLAGRAAARVVAADQLPTVGANFSGARTKRSSSTGFRLTSPVTDSFNAGLDFAWELDLWGKLAHRGSAAIADVEAADAEHRGARLSLAANTAKAWFRVIEARLQLELAGRALASFTNNVAVIEASFQRGVAVALDVRLTRANVESARATAKARARERDDAVRSLEVLLGRYPADRLTVAVALPAIVREVPAGVPSELLRRRPDLIAAERRLAAADERLQEARKNLFPTVSLTASGGQASDALEELLDPQQNVWRLAANLVQPLFQGGRLRGARDQVRARLEEAAAIYAGAVLGAFQEVETTLAAEGFLREQEAALQAASRESIAAEELAWEQYQRGLVDIITVLESQRRSVGAQSSLLAVSRGRLQNRVDLYLALGGDFILESLFNLTTLPPQAGGSESKP